MDGEEGEGAGLDGLEVLEGVGVGDSGVVESGEGFGVDDAGHFGGDVGAGEDTFVAELLGTREGFPEYRGGFPLLRVQVDVAAADGKAVGLTNGGYADDFEGEVDVPGHASDDDQLLGILLAEVSAVGLDDVKELGHDGGDTYEVAGSRGAFVEVRDRARIDFGVGVGTVHFVGRGGEYKADTRLFKHAEVTVEVSGVGGEVFVGAELSGVDEDGGGNGVVLGGGAFYEGHVAAVEVTHGGDEAEGAGC